MRWMLVAVFSLGILAATPVPSPKPPYPEIAHVVSKRFCTALRNNVGPAIAGILNNDRTIASAQPLFADYNTFNGSNSTAHRDLTLMRMENLVSPLVNNLAAIEKLLQDPSVFPEQSANNVFPAQPAHAEDATLVDIRNKLEQVAASQEESLDVINGFVASEQLAQMQHEGFDQANALNADMKNIQPTADPNTHDTTLPGLPPNPYYIDPTNYPGSTLGTNPIKRVAEGLQWTRTQAAQQEHVAAKAVIDNLQLCNGK